MNYQQQNRKRKNTNNEANNFNNVDTCDNFGKRRTNQIFIELSDKKERLR